MNPLRLIVIHHVFLYKCWRAEYLAANCARSLSDSVNVSHVVKQRALGRTHFGTNITLVHDVFWLADSVIIHE